jgi:hypothetical protein
MEANEREGEMVRSRGVEGNTMYEMSLLVSQSSSRDRIFGIQSTALVMDIIKCE